MESSAPPAASDAAARPSFLVRHQFLIYRLFSLSGLIPVGAYMVVHLLTNATILNTIGKDPADPTTFQKNVDLIHSLGIALPFVEWTFIFIPILFHATVGWLIISGAVPNTNNYPYASNIRYTMQRVTGMVAFLFIMFHVLQLHGVIGAPFKNFGGAQFDPHHAASSAATALEPLWVQVLYVIGVLSCVYHFANGLWSQGITWGLWTSAQAQRRASWVSVVVGLGLAVVSLSAIGGFSQVNVESARKVEDAMIEQHEQIENAGKATEPDKAAATNR